MPCPSRAAVFPDVQGSAFSARTTALWRGIGLARTDSWEMPLWPVGWRPDERRHFGDRLGGDLRGRTPTSAGTCLSHDGFASRRRRHPPRGVAPFRAEREVPEHPRSLADDG